MSYGSDWACECGWGNLDVRRKCRHCGKAKPECPPALTVTETADEGVVAWRAVAHPETGMGAMIHPIKRFLVQDADGIYGEGQWELQALVVRSSAADTAYNVSEAHMFGPPVDPVHPPAEARALAAEAEFEGAQEQADSFKAMYRQACDWRDAKIAAAEAEVARLKARIADLEERHYAD